MSRCLCHGLGAIVLALLLTGAGSQGFAQSGLLSGLAEPYPLRAADTSSPRDTLRSFIRDFGATVEAWRNGKPRAEILRPQVRASDTIDFSDLTLLGRESAILIHMALLEEVLDRVELPPYENIPGDAEVAANEDLVRWTVPNTKIEIVKIQDGPRAGEFLFSKETVAKLHEYYSLAKEIPYKAGALVGIYEEVLASPGQWVPQHLPDRLPRWANQIIGGQGIWQWIAVVVLAVAASVLFPFVVRLGMRWDIYWAERSPWLRFGLPAALLMIVGLAALFEQVAQHVIGLLELPLTVIDYLAVAIQLIAGSWFIVVFSMRLADALGEIGQKTEGKRRLDTALLRILFRLISVVFLVD